MSTKEVILLLQGTSTAIEATGDLVIHSFDFHNKSQKLCIILDGELLELQSVQPRKFGSLFINQKVSSSKSFYIASKFDARFLCLKHFEIAPVRYCPLNQTIMSQDGLAAFCLNNVSKLKLDEICDVNDKIDDEIVFYRYNAIKTQNWLRDKVRRLAIVLRKKRIERTSHDAFVNNFDASKQNKAKVTTTEETTEPLQEDIKQAIDIISEYISEDLLNKILTSYDLTKNDLKVTKVIESQKRKADWEVELELEKETIAYASAATAAPTAKPIVKSNSTPAVSSAATKAANAVGKIAKVNAQAAKGTMSINSFFTKPSN